MEVVEVLRPQQLRLDERCNLCHGPVLVGGDHVRIEMVVRGSGPLVLYGAADGFHGTEELPSGRVLLPNASWQGAHTFHVVRFYTIL